MAGSGVDPLYDAGMPRNRYYDGPVSDYFDGERFFIKGFTRDKSLADLWRWRTGGNRAQWPEQTAVSGFDTPPTRVEADALRVSFVGHASLLIQTRGINLLIDPVWSQRASPVPWAGPKRVNPPGIRLADLPPLDVVLVSHNHYDHMDLTTLSQLSRAHAPRVLTPLGNDAILRRYDRNIAAEAYDWGARVAISRDIVVWLTPAYHWSARGLGDRRMALWCAFVIETPDGAIYHVADTAWGEGAIFSDIRQRFSPVRLAILPIGAYAPRWFMGDNHIEPEEAVGIFQLTGARYGLAHHWGTFQLTEEAIDEPPRKLFEALAQAGVQKDRFRLLSPGDVWEAPRSSTEDEK